MASQDDYFKLMSDRPLPFFMKSEVDEVAPGERSLPYQTQAEADPYFQAVDAGKSLMQNVINSITAKPEPQIDPRFEFLSKVGQLAKLQYDRFIGEPINAMGRIGGAMTGKNTYPIDEINDPQTIKVKQAQDVLEALSLYSGPGILAGKPMATVASTFGGQKLDDIGRSMAQSAEKGGGAAMGKIGEPINFIRFGKPVKNSADYTTNQKLSGMSVYPLDEKGISTQTIRGEFADRSEVYIGTGKVTGFGSDGEPLVSNYKLRKATKDEEEIAYYGKLRKEWLKEHGFDEQGNKIDLKESGGILEDLVNATSGKTE